MAVDQSPCPIDLLCQFVAIGNETLRIVMYAKHPIGLAEGDINKGFVVAIDILDQRDGLHCQGFGLF